MPSSITDRFEKMTGLDLDGNGAVGSSSPPSYPLLSTTYATFKSVWVAGKDYQITKPLSELAENVASKVVSVAGKTTLADIDVSLEPALSKYDYKVSPLVENTVAFMEKKKEENEGVVKLVCKVLPIQVREGGTGRRLRRENFLWTRFAGSITNPRMSQFHSSSSLLVQTVTSLASVFYGIFEKNLKKVGSVLLIEIPETTNF